MASEAVKQTIDGLLEEGDKLADERQGVYDKQAANRSLLRNFVKSGAATKAQSEAVERLYPTRVRTRNNGEAEAEQAA